MVRDEDMFEAFRACLRHKASSPSAIKYFPDYQRDLLRLCDEINARTYRPSTSITFIVTKPKLREVFAACFRDRIVHHYIALRVEPLLENLFCDRTFNCRTGKGVLYGVNQLQADIRECSENYTKDVWIAKFDLQGFFMSIDVNLLNTMLQKFIRENYKGDDLDDVLWLSEIIMLHEPEKNCERHSPMELWHQLPKNKSLFTNGDGFGLPIGNLPSQHNANFLLHWLDMLIEKLGYKYHGRYVDDGYFMMVCETEEQRQKMLHDMEVIRRFLSLYLHVRLHPDKFYFQHYKKGVQFIGSIVKPNRVYVSNRTIANARDAVYRLNNYSTTNEKLLHNVQSLNSYLGTMVHYNTYHLRRQLAMMIEPELWDRIYFKGHYESVHIKKVPTNKYGKKLTKDDFPQVIYMKDPINYELAEINICEVLDNQDVSKQ